ncbi:hypothetical protein BDP27DRAFT_689711 [Rhodocollybia butyracea]|uniref:Uncharacterized protein n=1 Tax=Rhodocollybia butyracea TaxID=206335 RepID=A0A9P5TX27_9AGAR|nr:hypothetical protein BDP27DRAFT_689711 [Rhodocollybia butyracea]
MGGCLATVVYEYHKRIIHACRFRSTFFIRNANAGNPGNLLKWEDVLPSWTLIPGMLASALIIRSSEMISGAIEIVQREGQMDVMRQPVLLHIALGGILVVFCLGRWAWTARRFLYNEEM